MSTEITPLAIFITDRVGEGKLGMMTTFCRSDQAKVEPLDTLSALVQQDSPKPGVVAQQGLLSLLFLQSPFPLLWFC